MQVKYTSDFQAKQVLKTGFTVEKMPIFGAWIDTVKYAISRTWNVKFENGLMSNILAILKKIVTTIVLQLYYNYQFSLFFEYSTKIILTLLMFFGEPVQKKTMLNPAILP
jgi:hypothetical protein